MNKFFGILFLGFFSFSCSSDLDFNQAKDIELEPVAVANFATFDILASRFLTSNQLVEVVNYDIFTDPFFKKSLYKAELLFEINNTINRAYRVNLNFLDVNNLNLYTIPFDVPAYSGSENLLLKTEIFADSKLEILKQTKKIEFDITMLPGPLLSASSSGSLKLRSSSTVYLLVKE